MYVYADRLFAFLLDFLNEKCIVLNAMCLLPNDELQKRSAGIYAYKICMLIVCDPCVKLRFNRQFIASTILLFSIHLSITSCY
jgi:hypothetical protein